MKNEHWFFSPSILHLNHTLEIFVSNVKLMDKRP